jgi:hypothetical protein
MVRESSPPPRNPITERQLQCVWFDDSLRPKKLFTDHGEAIVVEHPGRWNLEAGPDFIDATLRIGPEERLLKGDVELHIRPSDWTSHGHSKDPAYSRVIGHVTFHPGTLPPPELPAGAVQMSLRDPLKTCPTFSFEYLDVTAYPYARLVERRAPCADSLSKKPVSEWIALLESAGQERLRRKAEKLAESIAEHGAEQVFYEEIMASLGYKHNKLPFRKLASIVPMATLDEECKRDSARAYAIMLGAAGLLPSEISDKMDTETRGFMRKLWNIWWKKMSVLESLKLPAKSWKLSSLRPQNHPVRRLAAAASMFTREPGMLVTLKKVPLRNDSWFKTAGQVIEDYASSMNYWQKRLTIGGSIQKSEIALLGQNRISSILGNVVAPLFAAQGIDVAPLLDSLPPEEDNSIIRHTACALFSRDHNPSLYRRGILQQGLIQIFQDFCIHNHADCANCALAESLKENGNQGSGCQGLGVKSI